MSRYRQALSTSIVKKWITAVSGLGLVGFVIMHLAGNLTLLAPSSEPFNTYSYKLYSFGPLLWAAEIGLLIIAIGHVINGILLKKNHQAARNVKYAAGLKGKGGPSKGDFFARNMALSGIFLLVFLVVHIIHFKFGPAMEEGYVTTLQSGEQVRDLHRLVVEEFSNPWIVGLYVLSMVLLGGHLKHGIWSAFQSLGVLNRNSLSTIYVWGIVMAILLAIGFLILPIWLYIAHGAGGWT